VAEGSPETVAESETSYTAHYLKKWLNGHDS
jgi:excinuclease UvrABC ATPase subunit